MQTRWSTTLFITLALVSISVVPRPVLGDAPNPTSTLAIGDWWKYSFEETLGGLFLTGTMTQTLKSVEPLTTNGTTHTAYRMAITGSGTVRSGICLPPYDCSWTLKGDGFQRTTNLAQIRTNIDITVLLQAGSFSVTSTLTLSISNSPPVDAYRFPIAPGQTWSAQTTTLIEVATSGPQGSFHNSTSIHATLSFIVIGKRTLTVPAGSYETYLVGSTDEDGAQMNDYYSPEVQASVKNVQYNATGYQTSKTELLDYSSWSNKSSLSVSFLLRNYGFLVETDASTTNLRLLSGSISFRVSGPDGGTGRAQVTFPVQVNRTSISVQLDGKQISAQISKNSTHYQVLFAFPLSTHTITVVFATGLFAVVFGQFFLPLLLGGTVFIVVVLAVILVLVLRRRKLPQTTTMPSIPQTPTAEPPGL